MKTISRLTLSLILLASSFGAGAQTLVKGTVADSLSRQPVEGSVIQFFKAGEEQPAAYSVTDSTGAFSRTFQQAGKYEMVLQNLGWKNVRRVLDLPGEGECDLGTILVQEDSETLNSASVQAMKTLVRLDVGKLTYKVEEDPDSKTGTVLDMLRKVPMVTVDGQDNITVNGSSNFKVYVDGKPNQMLSSNPSQILKAMPAAAIKDIEVITNPGAKYDAEGAGGILNLITGMTAGASTTVPDGFYGSVTLGVTSKGENASVFASVKKGKLTLGVNSAVGEQKLGGITFVSEQKNLVSGTSLNTDLVQKQESPFAYADINASYEVDDRNLISGSFGLTGFYQKAASSALVDMTGPDGYSYDYDQNTKSNNTGLNASLDYQHTSADVPGRTLTLSYRYSGAPTGIEYTTRFSSGPYPMYDRRSQGNDNSQENTFQVDYTTPLGQGHSLSSGLKFIDRHNSADDNIYFAFDGGDKWTWDGITSMLYDHFNEIGALYSEYTGTFGKFQAVAGLRYEQTWQQVRYGRGNGKDFNTSFGDLVPNASLQYNISAMQNVGVTYNRRISRPGITFLNPYVERSSPTYISYGNTNLTSARSDILSLVYNFYNPKWVVSLTGRYAHSGSGISAYSFFGSGGVLNTTYGNIVSEDNTGLTAFINLTAGPKTRIYTNTSFGYSSFKSKEMDMSNGGWSWNTVLGVQQTLPSDILLSFNLTGSGRTWNLQGWTGGYSLAIVGLSKGLLEDRLRITVQAATNINQGNLLVENLVAGKDNETWSKVEVPIRQVGVGLTWNFGKQGFQVKKTRKTINNDDVINNTNGQTPGTSAAQVAM